MLGVDGLRVADASVMPKITSGPTAASAMMIGVAAFEFLQADRRSAGQTKTEGEK